jgi:hypothetical protein
MAFDATLIATPALAAVLTKSLRLLLSDIRSAFRGVKSLLPVYHPASAGPEYDMLLAEEVRMLALQLAWWHWMLLGLALLLGEVLTPGGFYLIFFGAAAILTAVLKLAGLDNLALEGLIFAAGAIVSMVLFRRPLLEKFRKELNPHIAVDDISHEQAVALQDIAASAMGKVELRGTAWNALNVGDDAIPTSARCRVEKVDGLTLRVRKL